MSARAVLQSGHVPHLEGTVSALAELLDWAADAEELAVKHEAHVASLRLNVDAVSALQRERHEAAALYHRRLARELFDSALAVDQKEKKP